MNTRRRLRPIATSWAILALTMPIALADEEARPGGLIPTRVPRDLAGRPTAEVVDEIGKATGFPLRLVAENKDAAGRSAEAPGVEGGPTFWEALDLIAREGRLEIVPRLVQRGHRLELGRVAARPAPSTVLGAFRCSLIRLVEDRRVLYGDPRAEVPESTISEPARMAGKGLPPTWERSHALIRLMAEPRGLVDVRLSGPPRVDEAVDDQGRSLVAAPPKVANPSRYAPDRDRFRFGLDVHVPLDLPDPPARSLRRFRGVVPVVCWVEHPQPLDVTLAGSAGRKLRGSGVHLEVIPGKATAPAGTITLLMSPEDADPPARLTIGLFESGPGRMFLDHEAQFEVYDAAEKRVEVSVRTDPGGAPWAFRVVLTPKPGPSGGIPARLRYRGLAWSRADVPFAFEGVSLP